ncbi:hypothetical protein BurJ1DRAFT_2783 [Burkholderiales bacterium JOSHI_001]|nr:hypothetical protein BurJ1DRAFT_2783 [Burkholderiales bacterium JOSHI_001]
MRRVEAWRHAVWHCLRDGLLALALLAAAAPGGAQTPAAPPSPPAAKRTFVPLHGQAPRALHVSGPAQVGADGSLLFAMDDRSLRYWPASGQVLEEALPIPLAAGATVLHTPWGLLAVGGWTTADDEAQVGVTRVQLIRPDGQTASAELSSGRFNAQAVLLADGSALVVGGTQRFRSTRDGIDKNSRRTTAVDRVVWRDGRLQVTRMADLPGPPRRGFALVALADGRALVAGGGSAFYVGCMEGCLAEAYLFDPRSGQWQTTAPMATAREGFSATRLPDGRVLVAGGWSPGRQDADDRVETFDPASGLWAPFARLPTAVAQHSAVWLPGEEGRVLLLGGGTQGQVQALDLARGVWSSVAELREYRVGAHLAPYRDAAGQPWLAVFGGVKSPRGQDRSPDPHIERLALYLPGPPPAPAPASVPASIRASGPTASVQGLPLHRMHMAIAVAADGRTLFAGGKVHADPGGVSTASAELVIPGQPLPHALPAMQHARNAAQALWLADGRVAVLGGQGQGYTGVLQPADKGRGLPAEFHDPATQRWSLATEAGQLFDAPVDAVYDLAPNGDLIELTADGVARLQVQGNSVSRQRLPPLWLPHAGGAVVRALADGRIAVAGGRVSSHMIGLAGEPGHYVGLGNKAPARRYEVFHPTTGRWAVSAALDFGMHQLAVLDDGRVAALGEAQAGVEREGRWVPPVLALALSSLDGASWRPIPLPPGLVTDTDQMRLLVQQGELVLLGRQDDERDNVGIAWIFDLLTGRWTELARWSRRNAGMHLLTVTTPRGRRAVLATD